MPCYTIITSSVQFQAKNVDLLKKALEKEGWNIIRQNDNIINVIKKDGFARLTIDLKNGQLSSQTYREKELSTISNSLKRGYSSVVIDEISRRNKWIRRNFNESQGQLQRF